MKRWIPILVLCLCGFASAQMTTVTGTILDPIGIPYGRGTILPILIFSGGTPMFNGSPYLPPQQATGLDNSGSFIVNVAANSSITPGGSQWNFLVCSALGTEQPAVGKAGVCFSLASPITISGSTQSITTQLNAVALPLTNLSSGGGGGGVLTGSGTAATFPIFTGTTTLGNSRLTDTGPGNGIRYTGANGDLWTLTKGLAGGLIFNNSTTGSTPQISSLVGGLNISTSGLGTLNISTGTSGSNFGAAIALVGGSPGFGGQLQLTAGGGAQGGDLDLIAGNSSSFNGGNVVQQPGTGSGGAATSGTIYVNGQFYSYDGITNFAGLTVPGTNVVSGVTVGARIICTDCKGARDGVLPGVIASGSGLGADLFYDGVNWRVFTGAATGVTGGVTKDFSVSGCTPASSTDSQCTGTITISPAFADASYIPQLTVNNNGTAQNANLSISVNGALAAGSIPYTLTCTFNCSPVNAPTIYVHAFHP
jgi:hypothetical protein